MEFIIDFYRDGKVDMVLFPGGYATINGTAVTFHYYTQDYLGNNPTKQQRNTPQRSLREPLSAPSAPLIRERLIVD